MPYRTEGTRAGHPVPPGPTAREPPDVNAARLTMPEIVLTGGHDVPSITERGRLAAARMPDARHLHPPRAGHLPARQRPGECTELLPASATDPT